MAADYDTYGYTADSGLRHPIRMSASGALAQPTIATLGVLGSSISARVGGSRRALGLIARGARLKRSTGTGVAQKSFFTFLPVLLLADLSSAAFNKGAAITVDGVAYTVSKRLAEISN